MIASFRYIRAKIVNSLTDNYSKCYNRKSMKVFIREKKSEDTDMGEVFYDRLKRLRKEANLTQGELSEILLVHIQTISRWERGLIEPDISQLGELSVALRVSLEKLLGAEETELSFTGTFDAVNLGKTIQSKRQKAGESQKELAERIFVSADAVSRWERGVTCPSIEELIKLSEYFNAPVSEIYYGFTEEKTPTIEPVVYTRAKRKTWFIATVSLSVICVVMSILFIIALNLKGSPEITHTVTVDGVSYEISENSVYIPTPSVKNGYEFVRWENSNGETIEFPQIIDADKTYFAVYAPKNYPIDYWLNGGTFSGSPKTAITVEDKNVYLPTPEKDGAVFTGWYLSPNYSGEAVSEISCEYKNVTLYAKWDTVVYAVRYELSGGFCPLPNAQTVTCEKEEILNNPIKKGHVFIGWFDEADGGNIYTAVGGKNAKNVVLYAKWQRSDKYFEISYDLGGGSLIGENPSKIASGEMITLNAARKNGYEFLGWNDREDGQGNYYETLYGIYENLSLYAVYRPKTYLIRYEYDGVYETEKTNPNIFTYGDEFDLLPVYKYGYEFLGWFTEKSETAEKIERIDASNVADIDTLYAVFDVQTYLITLDSSGGVIDEADITGNLKAENGKYVYRATIEYPSFYLPACRKEGYVFLGWFRGETVIDRIGADNMTVSYLSAKWEKDDSTYNITYDLKYDLAENDNPATFLCRKKLVLNEPTLDGYEFLGWYDNEDGFGKSITFIPANNQTDVKLFAAWQKIIVSGTYDDFAYDSNGDYVKITGYEGERGENVKIVLPAKINGLPVVGVSDLRGPFYSVTIPEGVITLGSLFLTDKVVMPLKIPATVKTIDKNAFMSFKGEILFSQDSLLERIDEKAFYEAVLVNLMILPDTVKYIGANAFSSGQEVVMSDGIEYVTEGFKARVFFSENAVNSLKNAQSLETELYMPRSAAMTDKIKSEWRIPVNKTALTLVDGEDSETFTDYWFALPERNKTGYTFIGWETSDGCVIPFKLYVPNAEAVTLTARYIKNSDNDGLFAATAKPLEINGKESFNLYVENTSKKRIDFFFTIKSDKTVNVMFDIKNSLSFRITPATIAETMVAYIDENGQFRKANGITECKKGMIFCVTISDSNYFTDLNNIFFRKNLTLTITIT